MLYKILLSFFIWFHISTISNGQQDFIEEPCETPDKQNGICISIRNCSSLLELLRTQRYKYQVENLLKIHTCGFDGGIRKICCKQMIQKHVVINPHTRITQKKGQPCETPDEQPGTCISLDKCSSLLSLVTTQSNNPEVQNFLKASSCGHKRRKPIVCCKATIIDKRVKIASDTNTNQIELPTGTKCGLSNITEPKIVNGVPAKLGEFPWIVALGYRNPKNPDIPKWLCGGSLITEKHVLTAAHCVEEDLYLARLGDLDLYSDDDGAKPVTIPLIKKKIHKQFKRDTLINDIAILTLKETVNNPNIWPVCLPVKEPFRSMDYVNSYPAVVGWGAVNFKGPTSPILLKVITPVLRNNDCDRAFGGRGTIDNKKMCTGYLQGGRNPCEGDSGGPLMHLNNDHGTKYKTYQIGIVSGSHECATATFPEVYTRVTAYINWIKNNLG